MQTHDDDSHRKSFFIEKLKERAQWAKEQQNSTISSGFQNEKPIVEWKAKNGAHLTIWPDDEQKILRISCGGGDKIPVPMHYISIRGPVQDCINLLRKSLNALQEFRDKK